jgi:predicted nucleic acid-binding protein
MRIYVDTSVIGGIYDDLFAIDTIPLFDLVKKKEGILLVSDLLNAELLHAPKHVKKYFKKLPKSQIEKVELTLESRTLADYYIKEKVVGKTSLIDCQHIAIATVSRADVLASWNFKHIVNLQRIRGYNSINLRHGYPMLEIRTPKEIFTS